MKIASKISLSFFAATFLLTGLTLSISYVNAKGKLRTSIENNLVLVVSSRTHHIETYLQMLESSVGQFSKSVTLENFLKIKDKEDPRSAEVFSIATKILRRTQKANLAMAEFFLMDATGKVVASSDESDVGMDYSMDSIFLGAQKKIYIKDAYYSETFKAPLLAVSAPFLDSDSGSFLGVLASRVKLDDLNAITTEKTGMGKTGELYIINKYGYMITPVRFGKDTFLKQKVDTENARRVRLHKGKEHTLVTMGKSGAFRDYRGVWVLGAHGYIPQMHWGVLAEIRQDEAFAPLVKMRLVFLMVFLAAPFFAWGLGLATARVITDPLHELQAGMRIVGGGDLDHRVGTSAKDEVGQLSRAFDLMVRNLKNKTTSIENLNREIGERKMLEKVSLENALFLQKLMDSIPSPVFYKDISGIYIGCNRAFEVFFGISQKQLVGKKVEELFPPEVAAIYQEKDAELFALPGIQIYEASVKNASGKVRHLVFHKATFTGPSGEVHGIIGVIMDITLRKQTEEQLRVSHARYEQVVSHITDIIWRYEVDAQGQFVSSYISPVADRILGVPAGTIGNSLEKYFSYVHPDDISHMQEMFFTGLRTRQKAVELESRLVRPDGTILWVHSTGSAYEGENGGSVGFGTTSDITARKRTEELLRESEKRFMDVLYASRDAILLIDNEIFVDCNEATARMLGYSTRAEFLMKHPSELSPPRQFDGRDSFEKANEMMRIAFERGYHRFEWMHRKASGEDFPVEVSLTPIAIHGKNALHCLWRDLTEHKKTENKIKQLSQAMEQSPSCIVITDREGTMEYVNQRFTELTGYSPSEVLGKNPRILKSGEQSPEFYKDLWDTILRGKDWQGQICNKKKSGELYWELAHIAPIRDEKGEITHFVAVKEDVTYRRQIEEQLRHSLRMEAVGRLAGGIAHDFNNMLTVINGYSGYLLERMKPEDPSYGKIREIRDAGDCAASVVRQLLNLSRKEAPKPQLIRVSDAAEKMGRMIKRLIRDDVEFKAEHEAESGFVRLDPGQMEQVLLNLLVNAREAMPEGGTLTVTTGRVRMEEIHEELKPSKKREGDFVRITVSDTGVGIDPSLRARVFEPFFTTKKRGMNTGLGLSIVCGIVEEAGGAISFESQIGRGTTFRVYLPRVEGPTETRNEASDELPPGRGKILLVEDENQVREFALQVLRERGYDVRAARGGEEALAMVAEDPGRKIDLLLTDLTMPKMNGKELVLRIRETIPDLKVIFMSGYSEQMVSDVQDAEFLQKPFGHGQLSVKVWSVLGR